MQEAGLFFMMLGVVVLWFQISLHHLREQLEELEAMVLRLRQGGRDEDKRSES